MKRTITFLLCTLLALLTSACSISSSDNTAPYTGPIYPVYLGDSSDQKNIFSASCSIMFESDLNSSEPSPTKEFLLGNDTYILQYEETLPDGRDVYSSSDKAINCQYISDSDKLYSISATAHPFISKLLDNEKEETYLNAIKQIVALYTQEDWEQYQYSCHTYISSNGSQTQYPGFLHAQSETEKVRIRMFSFIKYIDGFATGDQITLGYFPETKTFAIKLSQHDFDDTESLDLNLQSINASIRTFLENNINSEKYTCDTYKLESSVVVARNGKFYYCCDIRISYISKESSYTGKSLESNHTLYVELPEESIA